MREGPRHKAVLFHCARPGGVVVHLYLLQRVAPVDSVDPGTGCEVEELCQATAPSKDVKISGVDCSQLPGTHQSTVVITASCGFVVSTSTAKSKAE